MNGSGKHIKVLAIILLLVQLCLPVSGPVYISEYLSTAEASDSNQMCAHTDADSSHESQDGHEQIPHCHELDAPCETSSGPVVEPLSVISNLIASDKGSLLSGYLSRIEIPPENRV